MRIFNNNADTRAETWCRSPFLPHDAHSNSCANEWKPADDRDAIAAHVTAMVTCSMRIFNSNADTRAETWCRSPFLPHDAHSNSCVRDESNAHAM